MIQTGFACRIRFKKALLVNFVADDNKWSTFLEWPSGIYEEKCLMKCIKEAPIFLKIARKITVGILNRG